MPTSPDIRSRGFFRRDRGNPPGGTADDRIPYNKYIAFHADEDNGVDSPLLVSKPVELADLNPSANMQGAPCLWRDLDSVPPYDDNYNKMFAQRAMAAAYGCESPTIVIVPYTNDVPLSDDPVARAAQMAGVLAALPAKLALYVAENPIFIFGNMNADNTMPEALPVDRNAAWFAHEADAFAIISGLVGGGPAYRWASGDDNGTSFLCQTMGARRTAWAAVGLDPDDCEFHAIHNYVVGGWIPSHYHYAVASLARIGDTTPIRITEFAFGFLGAGVSDADKPWLFTEYARGNTSCPPGVGGTECPPQSLTWTRYMLQWAASNQIYVYPFDATMYVRMVPPPGGGPNVPTLTSWGTIVIEFQHSQPAFVSPGVDALWMASDAPAKAYAIALSNGGDPGYADDVYDWALAGHAFSMAP